MTQELDPMVKLVRFITSRLAPGPMLLRGSSGRRNRR